MSLLILVVDDEPDVELLFRQQFRRDLRAGRFTMEFVPSATAALLRIADATDVTLILILSDINMPGMSGLDLLPKAKAVRPDVPVIMITAHTSKEDEIQALRRGATDYIPKPFNNDELVMIVRRALGEKLLQDENVYLRKELAGKYNFANIIGRGSRISGW